MMKLKYRSVAQLARAPVSKTGGRGFESLRSCQMMVNRLLMVKSRGAETGRQATLRA